MEAIRDIANNSPKKPKIFWRTGGYAQDKQPRWAEVIAMHQDFVNSIERMQHEHVQVIDYGPAIWPRSFDNERIEGDMTPHYGLAGRLVLLHLLGNAVRKMEAANNP